MASRANKVPGREKRKMDTDRMWLLNPAFYSKGSIPSVAFYRHLGQSLRIRYDHMTLDRF